MSRKRLIIFFCVLLALLVLPMALPYLLGNIVLPWWAYVFYAGIILVNAGIYLIQRCLLIDRFFVRGRIGTYVLLSVAALIIGLGLQYWLHALFSRFEVADGLTVQDYLGFGISLSQLVMMSVLQLVTTFVALAIGMSDEWRVAAFRYNEAEKKNRTLARDVADLRGQVDALKRPAPEQQDSISVKIDLMKRRLPLDDILYVQSDGDYIVLHLSDGSAPMVLMTLKSLERQLPFDRFCRIHRSYLVNVDKVGGLKGGKVSVAGDQLPLSDSCKARFLEILSHKSLILKAE
ncbi:MAG: LytTR family transcriptional regulator DNA-binding domain-containing protein [Bacteroidales bacterium]|nr:LytTR family transcriptional regulator DNA-binding domain-containing protein [Bacteroidales bacterium]